MYFLLKLVHFLRGHSFVFGFKGTFVRFRGCSPPRRVVGVISLVPSCCWPSGKVCCKKGGWERLNRCGFQGKDFFYHKMISLYFLYKYIYIYIHIMVDFGERWNVVNSIFDYFHIYLEYIIYLFFWRTHIETFNCEIGLIDCIWLVHVCAMFVFLDPEVVGFERWSRWWQRRISKKKCLNCLNHMLHVWHIYLRLSQIVCQMYKVDGPLPVVSSNFTHLQDPLKGL